MPAYQTTSGINLMMAMMTSASIDISNIQAIQFESNT